MGEVKLSEVVVLDKLSTQHVEAGEKPAATRLLLIGDPLRGYSVGEVIIGRCHKLGIGEYHAVLGDAVIEGSLCRCFWSSLLELLQELGRDGSVCATGTFTLC